MYPVSVDWGSGSLFLGVVVALLVYLAVRIVWVIRKKDRTRKEVVDVGVLIVVLLILGGMVLGMNRTNEISVKEGHLEVRFLTGFKKVDITVEEIVDARLINWEEEPEYRPVNRTMGTGMGAYKEGRFTLENGKSAFLLTNSSKVLLLDTTEGLLMLGPDDLDGFYEDFLEQFNGLD